MCLYNPAEEQRRTYISILDLWLYGVMQESEFSYYIDIPHIVAIPRTLPHFPIKDFYSIPHHRNHGLSEM